MPYRVIPRYGLGANMRTRTNVLRVNTHPWFFLCCTQWYLILLRPINQKNGILFALGVLFSEAILAHIGGRISRDIGFHHLFFHDETRHHTGSGTL